MTTRIDCDSCLVRGLACHDCMVTVLLGPPPELTFDDDERRALEALSDSGLVPPLRLVQPVAGPDRGVGLSRHLCPVSPVSHTTPTTRRGKPAKIGRPADAD